jgi:hypothetical protein
MAPALFLSALFLFPSGCGKNTTGENNRGNARLAAQIHDVTGNPLPGFMVSTVPATKTALTDSLGGAVLEDIPAGVYQVTIQKTDYAPYTKKTLLVEGETESFVMVYLPEVTVTVTDDRGKHCPSAVITTDPPTWERNADANGKAVFQKMPQAPFRFIVKREGYPDGNFDSDAKIDVPITVSTEGPHLAILSPKDTRSFGSPRSIRFQGTGNDREDGELPDSSLVWISNRNGELGRGSDITVKELSLGQHTITLNGTDSDGKTGSAVIFISVADYQTDTFFPIPAGSTWNYRYLTPQFSVQDEQGQIELWVFNRMTVKIENDSKNKPTRRIEIDFITDSVHYLYTLIDNLEIKENSIYVTATQEQLQVLQPNSLPIIQMQIYTSYNPSCIFLKNITDVSAEISYISTVQAVTSIIYYVRGVSTEAFTETAQLSSSVQVSGHEVVETERGTFNVVNLTIRQGEYTRNWALAKGVGIVRFEDNTFLDKGVGLLSDASILKYYEPETSKQIPAQILSAKIALPALTTGVNTPENLSAIRVVLRSICPR